jgi:hypothetical protein
MNSENRRLDPKRIEWSCEGELEKESRIVESNSDIVDEKLCSTIERQIADDWGWKPYQTSFVYTDFSLHLLIIRPHWCVP